MATITLSGPSGTIAGTLGDDSFVVSTPPAAGTYTLGDSFGTDRLVIRDSSLSQSISFNFDVSSFTFRDGSTTVINPIGIGSGLPAAELVSVRFEEADGSISTISLDLVASTDPFSDNVAVVGTRGRDTISGIEFWGGTAPGRSYIFGGDGADKLTSSNTHLYVLDGGKGNDRLNGTDGMDDILYGGQGKDKLFGAGSEDTLSGGSKKDFLFGGNDGDDLDGGTGDDRLSGGNGSDILEGGVGRDRLSGGQGADEFVFGTTNQGRDTITQFQLGVDKIILDGITATNFSILAQAGGGSLVTVLFSGQQIFIDNLAATVIQSNPADIFELG